MKRIIFLLQLTLLSITLFAQRQQRIPTPYEFESDIRFVKPPELPGDTLANAKENSIATKGGRIYIKKDGMWQLNSGEGTPGKNGSRWIDSIGTPLSTTGVKGDFYIDRDTQNYFEKTDDSTWAFRKNLRGTKGEKGDDGRGVNILGSLADSTLLPAEGNYGDGYLITGKLWVWSETSLQFINVGNIQGPKGDVGDRGPIGLTGAVGSAGKRGTEITDSIGAPSPSKGIKGDYYLNRSTWDIYYKSDTLTWVVRGNIKGEDGTGGGVSPDQQFFPSVSAGQTAFTISYALPVDDKRIRATRRGVEISFTRAGNVITIGACKAGDPILFKWY